jgi:hypothetical protein
VIEMHIVGEITIDQIPLGGAFGLRVNRPEMTAAYQPCGSFVPTKTWGVAEPFRVWLTKRDDCGRYQDVRELPFDAFVLVKNEREVIEVYKGVVTIRRIIFST